MNNPTEIYDLLNLMVIPQSNYSLKEPLKDFYPEKN